MKTFRKKLLGKASAKETFNESFIKAQSAMEYLMTYGWAILIIAVVLGALFQLGVFNANNFAPKAPPGACQVFRPNGPYTTSFINLEGICSGELPQYTAQIYGTTNSYIWYSSMSLGSNIMQSGYTIAVWVNYHSQPAGCPSTVIVRLGNYTGSGYPYVGIDAGCPLSAPTSPYAIICTYNNGGVCGGGSITICCTPALQYNRWYFLAATYNPSLTANNLVFYENGQIVGQLTTYPTTFNAIRQAYLSINYGPTFNFSLANVQAYNTSLSANEIQALYLEGIGGAPIRLQNLVAWWPLNGNANDYSGNGNNGQINNANFVSNWYSGYTPP